MRVPSAVIGKKSIIQDCDRDEFYSISFRIMIYVLKLAVLDVLKTLLLERTLSVVRKEFSAKCKF